MNILDIIRGVRAERREIAFFGEAEPRTGYQIETAALADLAGCAQTDENSTVALLWIAAQELVAKVEYLERRNNELALGLQAVNELVYASRTQTQE